MLDDIVFSGGLGSQILSYMTLEVRKSKGDSPRVNVDYFYQSQIGTPHDSKLTYWGWELDRYGIALPPYQPLWNDRITRRLLQRHGYVHPKNASALGQLKQFDFRSLFPISDRSPLLGSRLGLPTMSGYCAIHIRRGDYLTASSRIITVDEIVALVQKLPIQKFECVIIFSDTPLDVREEEVLRQVLKQDIKICVGEDQHAVHGMLRSADLLITSNSTFSVTAGLLMEKDKAVVISPQHFFPNLRNVNSIFQNFGEWMIY